MTTAERGRPKTSSITALEDAATELFLEQGYRATTIDDIAKRAGISRATFFNYCQTKADVLWVDVDRALDEAERLRERSVPLLEALSWAVAAGHAERIPLVVTQHEAMGVGDELAPSAGLRIQRLHRLVAGSGIAAGDVWVVVGAVTGALLGWAVSSPPRVDLSEVLEGELNRISSVLEHRTIVSLFYTGPNSVEPAITGELPEEQNS
jgi:AcrR family transcriptional regulator